MIIKPFDFGVIYVQSAMIVTISHDFIASPLRCFISQMSSTISKRIDGFGIQLEIA